MELIAEVAQLWKTQREATYSGDARESNRAMERLIEIFKTFEKDRDMADRVLGQLLKQEATVASGVAAHCLALNLHISDALAVLRRIKRSRADPILSFEAEMVLKQWKDRGYLLMYPGQKPSRNSSD